ncbi:hypothetical protein [Hespellia stercorisuis]|uniref:Transposase, YhgA-like n=1 Tax=Hespellia stercorisuis DSM 15480 TaxID=1121950 RepID=A0A1M6UN55_9FIRM|nr:hypothetical protein [Hespellia stercorisuis]SHK70611.1 hypothetical protein SAMN02745243_03556 [Hespellia stercorisuis DSM 15480]
MMEIPDELKSYQPMMMNYKLNLLEVAKIRDLDTYGDDLKMVFGFVKYQRDKKALEKFVEKNRAIFSKVPMETCKAIEVLTNTKEISKHIEQNEDGREAVNVCVALEEMREDSKAEGRTEGRTEGEALFASLTEKLVGDNRMEDLMTATKDKEFRSKLYEEYNLTKDVPRF